MVLTTVRPQECEGDEPRFNSWRSQGHVASTMPMIDVAHRLQRDAGVTACQWRPHIVPFHAIGNSVAG